MPVVLASRYGDVERTLRLLKEAVLGELMSPADFTLSVHNAIGAVYSIARADTASYTSVAAGAASAAAGLIEAAALLADGAPEVALVYYETSLPEAYGVFADEPACTYAWAWRLQQAVPGQAYFSLEWGACDAAGSYDDPALPFGLQAHHFVLSQARCVTRSVGGVRWTWSRHAGAA